MNDTSVSYAQKINWLHISPLVLYFILSPIYSISSGLPQIADGIILIGILFFLAGNLINQDGKIRLVFFIGLCFAIYTIIINVINYVYFPHTRFLFSGIYYLYNIFIFIYVVKMFERYDINLKNIISSMLVLIVIAEFLWAVIMPQEHWRETGSFNNPNQLAYWSLLTAFMVVLLKKGKTLNWKELSLLLLLGGLEALALSKAGIISYSLFLIIVGFSPLISHTTRFAMMAVIMLLVSFGFLISDKINITEKFIEKPIERLQNIGQEPDDSTEARGYTRPLKFPAYVLFGAGEGAYDRFVPDEPLELHSAIVTIVFSYGIFGFALFAMFLTCVLNKKPLYIIFLFVPIFMMGLTGQSFRFSHFWILLALAYVSYQPQKPILK